MTKPIFAGLAGAALMAASLAQAQQPAPAAGGRTMAGAACGATSKPSTPDNATESKSGRKFILQFPCDLKPDEKVTLILNIHGAGSSSSYQHQYFPAGQYAQKYRLVVATPTALAAMPGRTWQAANDDQYLHDLTDLLFAEIGKQNIKSFWLAGHSQGGATSSRLVCSPFFRSKVDGFFSLSGGRVGGATARNEHYNETAPGVPPPPAAAPAAGAAPVAGRGPATPAADGPMTCDYSHIYDTGQWEVAALPETSAIAEKFGCTRRTPKPDTVDTEPGYTWDPSRQNPTRIGWGRQPRPGTAKMVVFEGCRDNRVVADIMRMDKGHTEGLEPKVTEEIIKLIVSAKGGRAQQG